jgi:tetratricopeptide (TPR) repeat protein
MKNMYYPFTHIGTGRFSRLFSVILFGILSLSFLSPAMVMGESDSDQAQSLRQTGLDFQNKGYDADALLYFSRAAVFAPRDPVIQNDLGAAYERMGKWDEAEASYRKALQLDRKYLPAYLNLGLYYKNRFQYELALMYLRRRVEIGDPQDVWTLRAQEAIEEIYVLAPQYKNTRTLDTAQELEAQFARDKARGRLVLERQNEMDYRLAMDKGLSAYSAAFYDTAVEAFESALAVRPGDKDAFHALERARTAARQKSIQDSLAQNKQEFRGLIVEKYLDETSALP